MYNLIGTHCENCGEYHYPPRNMCPNCRRSSKIAPYQFEGGGTIHTYTIVHASTKNFSKQTPYVLAIIKLDEGPFLTSQVVCNPKEVCIGMKVRSIFRKLGEENEKGMIYYGTKFVPMEVLKNNQQTIKEIK